MISYERLVEAKKHYSECGYKYIEVPWEVEHKVEKITKPKNLKSYKLNSGRLVASGEQGFLQLMKDGTLPTGSFQCITPCFRDEVVDAIHAPYFMKLELIKTINPSRLTLNNIIEDAQKFFSRYVECKVVETGDFMYDIVSEKTNIELGSYGLRQHNLVGNWVYGTGLAEPRLSYVIENNKG